MPTLRNLGYVIVMNSKFEKKLPFLSRKFINSLIAINLLNVQR